MPVGNPLSGEQMLTSVDGTKIWAESTGNPSKPALVFIHGLSCSALGFDKQFADEGLLENFHLIRYEMRGHSRSGQPLEAEAYKSLRYAEDFKTVCDAYGVDKPFLVGWSLGGVVAADVLNAYGPAALSGIIYCGGGMPHLHYMAATTKASLQPIIAASTSESAEDMAAAPSMFVDSCTAQPQPYGTKLQWMGAFVSQRREARIHSIERTQDASAEWERRARGVPVLVVQGTEDQHRNWEGMRELLGRVYADVEVCMLEGVGHAPHFEAAEETNRAIGAWVRKVVARACLMSGGRVD